MRFAVPFVCALLVLDGAVSAALAESPIRSEKTITLVAALQIAQRALDKSHADGATHVAIVVVDNAARTLVSLRDDHATEHPLLAAGRKAWTAANYRSSTNDILARIEAAKGDDGQLVHTTESLFLMGGVPIKDGEEVVDAIGVAGNPSGFEDHAGTMTAAAAFQHLLSANPR